MKNHEMKNHENHKTLQLESDCAAMEQRCNAIESCKIMISQKCLRCVASEVSLVTGPFFFNRVAKVTVFRFMKI